MLTYLVSANLVNICRVHNCQSAKDAIITAQTHTWEHKPALWAKLQDAEWLATHDIPPADPTDPIVEFCLP